jgi:hypothetical protein
MPTIIALEGAPGKGKPTTINLLYRLMKSNGYTIVRDRRIATSVDFFAIFEKKGKKVGISSYGDSVDHVLNKLDKFAANGCVIMVTACRIAGPIKLAVQNYLGCSKQFVTKTLANTNSQRLIANNSDAAILLSAINTLI